MKHAFLIIAHNNWDYLKQVIETLDSDLCDFYIHVNTRVYPKSQFICAKWRK